MRLDRRLVTATALALGFALSACGTTDVGDKIQDLVSDFNPFGTGKKPLPGERKPVFPEGVPGATQGVPPELMPGNQAAVQPEAAPAPAPAPPPKKKKVAVKKKTPRSPPSANSAPPADGVWPPPPNAAAPAEDAVWPPPPR